MSIIKCVLPIDLRVVGVNTDDFTVIGSREGENLSMKLHLACHHPKESDRRAQSHELANQ